jgi:two-component system sensor histidine kinase GlrK
LHEKTFYQQFAEGSKEFESTLDTLATFSDTLPERDLLGYIASLYGQYQSALATALTPKSSWPRVKGEISEALTSKINEFIYLREERIAHKTSTARDQAEVAATVVRWLTFGGIGIAVLLSFINARRVSRPLKSLTEELRRVGKGEFQRHLAIQSPEEIAELTQAFNWMAARLAMLDDMKEDFIAHVSHELRTPLTAIREGTTLLWEEIPDPLSPAQRQIVEVVRHHSERLFHFLSSVLDLSKMEAGMMEYVPVPSDLSVLVDRSTHMIQLMAQRKKIRIAVSCPQPLPLLSVDEVRMQQVFDNLLTNAVKFTPEGGLIKVSAYVSEERGRHERWVVVEVSDTGVGIPAEEAERIFDKFYQGPRHRRTHDRGTGLGLAIAQHIVVAHGGRIVVESQVGKGATFVVFLPVREGGKGQAEGRLSTMAMVAPTAASLEHRKGMAPDVRP